MRSQTVRRAALAGVGGAAVVLAALAGAAQSGGDHAGLTAEDRYSPLAPTTSAGPSYAPSNPVDCTDPNNAVNCQSPPIDSPLVVGTAEPGSPYRD